MRPYLSALILLGAAGAIGGTFPVRAQTPSQTTPQATLSARTAIQTATNNLDAALLRGDATDALKFLAPDFELGHYQYRKHDLAWMRQFLPRQLERARFTELTITISDVELEGKQAAARGRIQTTESPKNSGHGAGVSGGYSAAWVQTDSGWRLKGDDGVFFSLLQLNVSDQPPAAIHLSDTSLNKTTPLAENPSVVLEQVHQGRVEPLVFSPDGAVLVTNGAYEGLRFSSSRTGAFLKAMPTPMFINSMTYAPDGTLVTGHNDGIVRVWDVKKGALIRQFSASKWGVYAVAVSPDARTLAVDGGGDVQLWDLASGRKLQTFGHSGGNFRRAAFSPDGALLALETGHAIELWSVKDERLAQSFPHTQWGGFLPAGKPTAFVTTSAWTLSVHNLGSEAPDREVAIPGPVRQPLPPLTGTFGIDRMVLFPGATVAPDGKIAASIYEDGSIGIWDIQTGVLLHRLRGFQGNVMGGDISTLAFSPDSSTVAVGSRSGEVAVWNVLPPEPSHVATNK